MILLILQRTPALGDQKHAARGQTDHGFTP